MFGLISLLLTIAAASWWLMNVGPFQTVQDGSGTAPESNYQEAINAAEDLVDRVELRSDASLSGSMVPIYDGISVPSDVRTVDLSHRSLSGSLKAEIRQVKELEVLDISNNNFTGLPAEVGQLSKLRVLNLSYNPFTGLPHELGNLSELQVLDLRGTQYSEHDLDVIKTSLPESTQILTD